MMWSYERLNKDVLTGQIYLGIFKKLTNMFFNCLFFRESEWIVWDVSRFDYLNIKIQNRLNHSFGDVSLNPPQELLALM